uniref:Luciferin 4-monooxygenase n=1 Tax=Timema shepardi TaxID=629360 RepID=A0A7R9B1R1_TIMSH|nr:unnamed protein product [Timema shepardi]
MDSVIDVNDEVMFLNYKDARDALRPNPNTSVAGSTRFEYRSDKSVQGPRIEPLPPAQKSDTLPLDHQVTSKVVNLQSGSWKRVYCGVGVWSRLSPIKHRLVFLFLGFTMTSEHILQGPEALPVPNVSLGRYLLQRLREHGDRQYQVDAVSGVKTTFSEVLRKSTSLAESLRSHGVGVDDVVGVASVNSLEFCLPVLAAYYLGATCATFNPLYTVREISHALNISKPSIIFCSPTCVSKIEEASEGLLFVRKLVVLGDGTPMSSGQVPFHSFVQREAAADFAAVDVDPDQHVAAILCSSGTTGLPKGVMLTDRNIVSCIMNLA